MSGKTPLVLATVLLGLLAVATVLSSLYPTQSEHRQVAQRVFPELKDVSVDDVKKIAIEKDGETLEFTYDVENDRWVMAKPVNVLADRTAVRNIAFDLKQLTRKSIPGEEEGAVLKATKDKIVEYGLDSPSKKVVLVYLEQGQEKQVALLIGNQTADKDGWYVKREDQEEVFVVSKYSISSLDKDVSDFKQKRLIATNRWDAVSLGIRRSEEKILARREGDEWRLVEPVQERADADRIRSLVGALYDTSIPDDGFVDEDLSQDELSQYGLDQPQLSVEVGRKVTRKQDGEDKEYTVTETVDFGKTFEVEEDGKKQQKVYARLCGMNYIVAVNAGVLNDLNVSVNDLRDKDVVQLAVSDVDYVEIQQDGSRIVLARPDFDWKLYEPVKIDAHREAVEQLIQTIDDLRVREFLDNADPAEYGLDKPAVVIKAYKDGLKTEEEETKKEEPPTPEGTPVVIAFGKHDPEKGLVYVRRGDEKTVLAVGSDPVWERVTQKYLAYRTRRVLSFSRPDVVALSIYRDNQEFRLEKRKVKEGSVETDKWFLVSPVEAPADSTAVDDILWDLSNLDATKFYAEGDVDLSKYGLDSPAIRCTITLKAEEAEEKTKKEDEKPKKSQYVLLIGSQVEDNADEYYARLGDEKLIFGVAKRIVDLLTAELRERSLLKFTVDDVTQLSITYAQGPTLDLEYSAPEGEDLKKWTLKGGADFELDTEKVRTFVQYLSNLKADRYAQYTGEFRAEYGLASPALKVSIRLKDGSSYTLRIGNTAEEGKWYATTVSGTEGVVAVISGKELANVLEGPAHFAKKAEAEESKKPAEGQEAEETSKAETESKASEKAKAVEEPEQGKKEADEQAKAEGSAGQQDESTVKQEQRREGEEASAPQAGAGESEQSEAKQDAEPAAEGVPGSSAGTGQDAGEKAKTDQSGQ